MELLPNFNYYSEERVKSILKDIHEQLISQKIIDPYFALYFPIKKKSGTINSSYGYWMHYQYMNGISKERCLVEFDCVDDEIWDLIEDIVIIDDCAGTGDTFKEFIAPYKEKLKEKHIVYVIIQSMEKAVESIVEYKDLENLDVSIYNYYVQGKAFEASPAIGEKKDQFVVDSKSLGITEDLILGFKDSESLMDFYNNSPNNTVGVFVEEGKNYEPIFPRFRGHKLTAKQLRKNKEQRKAKNYLVGKGK